jgi:hypothetical protein
MDLGAFFFGADLTDDVAGLDDGVGLAELDDFGADLRDWGMRGTTTDGEATARTNTIARNIVAPRPSGPRAPTGCG